MTRRRWIQRRVAPYLNLREPEGVAALVAPGKAMVAVGPGGYN